jgi:hypothetical protein
LRLEAGEPVGDGLELLADRLKIIQALLESEFLEIIGAELVPKKCGELIVLLEEGDRTTITRMPSLLASNRLPAKS